jgi:septum formation protein
MILNDLLAGKKVVLASKSPRRQQILDELGIRFTVYSKDVDESFPSTLKRQDAALYLAKKKSDAFDGSVEPDQIIITADTIVCLDDHILNKPENYDDAYRMLRMLSGKKHEVITAVCIRTSEKQICFHEMTEVFFKKLSDEEITYYLKMYQPYDKAGAYGVQEWIGMMGLERINGSYHNVMGLPVQTLYQKLTEIITA